MGTCMHPKKKGRSSRSIDLTRGHLENMSDGDREFMQIVKTYMNIIAKRNHMQKQKPYIYLQTKMLLLRATVPPTSPFVANARPKLSPFAVEKWWPVLEVDGLKERHWGWLLNNGVVNWLCTWDPSCFPISQHLSSSSSTSLLSVLLLSHACDLILSSFFLSCSKKCKKVPN